jgi:hypothetical protein
MELLNRSLRRARHPRKSFISSRSRPGSPMQQESLVRPNHFCTMQSLTLFLFTSRAGAMDWSLISTNARAIGPISVEQDLDRARTLILGVSSPLSDLSSRVKPYQGKETPIYVSANSNKNIRQKFNEPPPLRRALLLVALASLALSPIARAVTPAPDGGYPGNNTAEGDNALFSLDTSQGIDNTAIGFDALFASTTGGYNTATGFQALFANTTGGDNTATGLQALFSNTTGSGNTANGFIALVFNTTGQHNTATGNAALDRNTTGNFNTANGDLALFNNTTGSNNVALGSSAGANLTTGRNNIDIGNAGVRGEFAKIRIGTEGTHQNTFIAGISGVTVAGGVGVIIDTNGHLGTVVSSARFKDAIKPMANASEAILALQPVTFRYKHELDPVGIPQFGLVAEQVAKVDPDLVARDEKGKPYTVRYEAVNAMLLNEFLKEHRKVEEQAHKGREQEATIAQLKSAIAQQHKDFQSLTAALKEEAAQIQKVSDQLRLSRTAPRVVADNQ